MSRIKLKRGGKTRPKALFGEDGIIMAAATLAAAGMTTAATVTSAKQQAKAVEESAKQQAAAIESQNQTNTQLQKESLDFTKEQNDQNRKQQQDIQTTLQLMAGQDNMNDRLKNAKQELKYGGKPKRRSIKKQPFYGGAQQPFEVTDGGEAIPVSVDSNGNGLYELLGNDHEHYHKTKNGKHKTGVGVKFADGSVVEGEGNQNTNQGEYLYSDGINNLFISKHSIAGFNPAKAINGGMHPLKAFSIQESLKTANGYNDDGTKAKHGKGSFGRGNTQGGGVMGSWDGSDIKYIEVPDTTYIPIPITRTFNDAFGNARKNGVESFEFNGNTYTTELGNNPNAQAAGNARTETIVVPIRHIGKKQVPVKKIFGGQDTLANVANMTQNPNNINADMATGISYGFQNKETIPVAKYGKRASLKKANHNRIKADNGWWANNAGATYTSIGNVLGAGANIAGNLVAGNMLNKAYTNAGNIMANAYNNLQTIDEDFIQQSDYDAPKAMAVVRGANIRFNADRERNRRSAAYQIAETNRGTMSSAARQQRLAAIQDRQMQAESEISQREHNANEQILQENANRITSVSQENANRQSQAIRDYTNAKLSLKQYNNGIINQRILGAAQASSDAAMQASSANATALQSSVQSAANAVGAIGQAYGAAHDAAVKRDNEYSAIIGGADSSAAGRMLLAKNNVSNNDKVLAANTWEQIKTSDPNLANELNKKFNLGKPGLDKDGNIIPPHPTINIKGDVPSLDNFSPNIVESNGQYVINGFN